jgi:hypothetical protein
MVGVRAGVGTRLNTYVGEITGLVGSLSTTRDVVELVAASKWGQARSARPRSGVAARLVSVRNSRGVWRCALFSRGTWVTVVGRHG